MSFKALVIPEDPTFNGYLLKPLAERLLAESGKPKAQVLVLRDPKTGGFSQAWDLIESGSLNARYGYYDLWLFLPDGDQTRDLSKLEQTVQNQRAPLIASYLTPEVEVAILAGHPNADTTGWQAQKMHPRFKEEIFGPFLKKYGNASAPGEGRERLMLDALKNYARMKRLLPEIAAIEKRISALMSR